jgi:hypothetical protein
MPENFLIGFENFIQDISQRPKMGFSNGFINFDFQIFERRRLIKKIEELKSTAGFVNSKKGRSKTV